MINRDVYLKDPTRHRLLNDGVARVSDDISPESLKTLRYELETFVCDGQYEKGIALILDTFLRNIDAPQQPAVWVSGFYGSGKSHLVKMLRALWVDTPFEDGATARGIAMLPESVTDPLKELSIQGKRHGLHAASGTLSSGGNESVRLALLEILFRSVGLPEKYNLARFVMWLKSENIYDAVKEHVQQKGGEWEYELDNLYVSEDIQSALMEFKPNIFPSPEAYFEILTNHYPHVTEISNEDMISSIQQALGQNGRFPLTLIVLDEVQQYIGGDSQRSINVQEVVESCCKRFGGKFLFIATGQTAVTGTSNLKKLEGRFTIRVELSDADVEAVVRKVILAKRSGAHKAIESVMEQNIGEISRHLTGTSIGHKQQDVEYFPQDYPILPVRRRFWEHTLRVLDQTGTYSQLRNQLSMIHKVIQTNLDKPLGNVAPADYLYFDAADKLLQSQVLPREVHAETMHWRNGTEDERLLARACGLVFLINKLNSSNREIGIRATVDTLADLLIEDLTQGSGALRSTLPKLLDNCKLLMKVDNEYRIQTDESLAWNNDFNSHRSTLHNQIHRIEVEREERIRKQFNETVRTLSLLHGKSKVRRDITPVFDSQLPADAEQRIYIWIRNGWSTDMKSVQAEARQAGPGSPIVYLYIPKRAADALRSHLIDYKAATATLGQRGVPSSAEGREASDAMKTTQLQSERRIQELIEEAFAETQVFQGGGQEILGDNLQEKILEAAHNATQRLYPQFHDADQPGWDKVYEKARKGAPDALKAVGWDGDTAENPVCKAILRFLGSEKKGQVIRATFEATPYGWSRDAVDGALQALLVAELIRAQDSNGRIVDTLSLERKQIGQTTFKTESITITAVQRIAIRKLLQQADIQARNGEELQCAQQFLALLQEYAQNAGGEPPKPEVPDTSVLEALRLKGGNDLLLAIYEHRQELSEYLRDWQARAQKVAERWKGWTTLIQLLEHANELEDVEDIRAQAASIEHERLLLRDPDPIHPLISTLTQRLRETLNKLQAEYDARLESGLKKLKADANWQQLDPDQRYTLMSGQRLHEAAKPQIALQSTEDICTTLNRHTLSSLRDRMVAMPARFDEVMYKAAALCEPKVQFIDVPRPTLKNEEDIDAWLDEVRDRMKNALQHGPIKIR